jgi:Ran GTPase-activating protein (RanGAP) involved in mRNA processing and transport
MQYLANTLKNNMTLVTLDLFGNTISAEGVQYLANLLNNNRVKIIHLILVFII